MTRAIVISTAVAAVCLCAFGCYAPQEVQVVAPGKQVAPAKGPAAPVAAVNLKTETQQQPPVAPPMPIAPKAEQPTPVDFTFPADAVGKSLETELTPPRGITAPAVPPVAAPRPRTNAPAEKKYALPAGSMTPSAWKYEGRVLPKEHGWVKSNAPALDAPPLGLAAEPPRPAMPGFATGPLVKGPAIPSPAEPRSEQRVADVKPLPTDGPPLSVAFTTHFPIVKDSGLKTPPAERIKVPDPSEIIDLIQLRQIPPDAEPPAFVPIAGPTERIILPVAPPPMPMPAAAK